MFVDLRHLRFSTSTSTPLEYKKNSTPRLLQQSFQIIGRTTGNSFTYRLAKVGNRIQWQHDTLFRRYQQVPGGPSEESKVPKVQVTWLSNLRINKARDTCCSLIKSDRAKFRTRRGDWTGRQRFRLTDTPWSESAPEESRQTNYQLYHNYCLKRKNGHLWHNSKQLRDSTR